jgi:hypothetical protein
MQPIQMFVAPQYLEAVYREMGGAFSPVMEFLRHKLAEISSGARRASAREYAELREVKSLISIMKYAGFAQSVRQDEIAWALQYTRDIYAREAQASGVRLIDRAAEMLDIDLASHQPMPPDLARRIANELILLKAETLPLAQVV